MIKRLRLRFILFSSILVFLVMGIIGVSINVIYYNHQVISKSNNILETLYSLGSTGLKNDEKVKNDKIDETNKDSNPPEKLDDLTSDMKNFASYFYLIYKTENENDSDTNDDFEIPHSFQFHTDSANDFNFFYDIGRTVLEKNSNKGWVNNLRYIKGVDKDNEEHILIICIVTKDLMDSFYNTLTISCLSLSIGFVAFLLVIVLVSFYTFKPVNEAYIKQKEFIRNAGHELKTPLSVISANNEIIELINGQSDETKTIDKQIKKMNDMVKSLTMLSQLEEKQTLKEKEEFDLSYTLLDSIGLVDKLIKDSNKELKLDIKQNIKYNGNEGLIRDLFSIIIDNALKYSISKIDISLKETDKNIIFEASNDSNIKEDGDHSEYFERFYRSPIARTTNSGSGIGLSIAKQISELHNINISCGSINSIYTIKLIIKK